MPKNPNRAAQNALLNILMFPGLGSLRAGRKLVGTGQIVLVLAGSILLLLWLWRELAQYYALMFEDVSPQSYGWLGVTGGILFVLAWLWAAFTSIGLFQEAATSQPVPPPIFSGRVAKLDAAKIISALTALPGWTRHGEIISRTFEFADFPAALKFVNAVAALAECAQHHPDMDIRWNRVTLALTTHAVGGLTEKDFALAHACDEQGRMKNEE
jgi:4a-hydroxytetrahydrobiopterin dehydratase